MRLPSISPIFPNLCAPSGRARFLPATTAMSHSKDKIEAFVNIVNRKATHDYELLDHYVAGMVLRGTEIKSIRQSRINMVDAFCQFKDDGLYVINLNISPYEQTRYDNHAPRADRKLLLKKTELKKLRRQMEEKGMTIVPRRLFINDRGLAKLEIATARGKKLFDKREDIKARDVKREMDRNMK